MTAAVWGLALRLGFGIAHGAGPALPEPILAGLHADTTIEEQEGDRYILAYESLGATAGKADAMKLFDLVAEQGTEGLARVGAALRPNGRCALRREYFADISDWCSWVYETFSGRFAEGKAEGVWRHTVLFCADTVIDESAVFADGVRKSGASLRGARWERGRLVSADGPGAAKPKPAQPAAAKASAITGARSRESMFTVVQQNTPELRAEYARRLNERPGIKGTVVVKFAVDRSGKVVSCQLMRSSVGDSVLEARVIEKVRQWTFGAIDKPDDITEMAYPFMFAP